MRIIDYKTGNVLPKELKLKDWEVLLTDTEFAKAFQLLFYTYVYTRKTKQIKNIEAGIYSMRALSAGLIKAGNSRK